MPCADSGSRLVDDRAERLVVVGVDGRRRTELQRVRSVASVVTVVPVPSTREFDAESENTVV
jgi:hypothetical protein